MGQDSGGVTVIAPSWTPLVVTLTEASGTVPTLYSDSALTGPVTQPVTVAAGATQKLYVSNSGQYTLSVKSFGVEGAAPKSGSTLTIDLSAGEHTTYDYGVLDYTGGTGWTNAAGVRRGVGNGFVFLGDSITIGNSDATNLIVSDSFPTYASLLSHGLIRLQYNAGVAGDTSTQMLARIQTDVIAKNPETCVVLAGTNDTGDGVSLATFQANIRAIVAALRTAQIAPILCTMPPNSSGTPANRKTLITQFNAWLRKYAEAQSIPLVDFYNLLVDPANGNYLAAYNNDGTHPNVAGYAAMGSLLNSVMGSSLPSWSVLLPSDNTDPNNLLANGLFLTDADANGVADGWGTYGGTTGVTRSLDTSDTSIKGNWQTVTISTAGLYGIDRSSTTSWSVGDTIAFTGLMEISGLTSGNAFAQIVFTGATSTPSPKAFNVTQNVAKGAWYQEYVIPSGTTAISVNLLINGPVSAVGKFAQVGIYNLTTLDALL